MSGNEIKKKDGFEGQKMYVVPRDVAQNSIRYPLLASFSVTNIGFFPHAKYHHRERPRACNEYIVIYCEKGEGWFNMNETHRKLTAGNILFIPKDIPHSYGANKYYPWSIYWCHMKGESLEDYMLRLPLNNYTVPVSSLIAEELKRLFHTAFRSIENGYSLETLLYVSHVIKHAMGLIFFANPAYHVKLKENYECVETAINVMKENLHGTITVPAIAETAKISLPHFYKLFKTKTGYSPINYFNRLKIMRACQYLKITTMKINEIADKLGFRDQYYFSRIFKNVMGVSPRQYRKSQIE